MTSNFKSGTKHIPHFLIFKLVYYELLLVDVSSVSSGIVSSGLFIVSLLEPSANLELDDGSIVLLVLFVIEVLVLFVIEVIVLFVIEVLVLFAFKLLVLLFLLVVVFFELVPVSFEVLVLASCASSLATSSLLKTSEEISDLELFGFDEVTAFAGWLPP